MRKNYEKYIQIEREKFIKMTNAGEYLKQRSENNKLLKDFKEIDKEKGNRLRDLRVKYIGAKNIGEDDGYIFQYPSDQEFYSVVTSGNFSKYKTILGEKLYDRLEDIYSKKSTKNFWMKVNEIYNVSFRKTEKIENELNNLIYESNNFRKEKGQTNVYLVEEILEGKISGLGYVRAPLIFKEVSFNRNINKREIKIKYNSSDKMIPNMHLFYELSSIKEIPIESLLNRLRFDKDSYKDSIGEILNELGLEFEWDFSDKQYVSLSKNKGNFESLIEMAKKTYIDLEKYRFLKIIPDEIVLGTNPILTELDEDKHRKLLFLKMNENDISSLVDYGVDEEDEMEEGIGSISNIPENMFDGDWKNERKKIIEDFFTFVNVKSYEEMFDSKKANEFANQFVSTRNLDWDKYIDFINNDIDFIQEIKVDVEIKNSLKIKPIKYIFKTEKLLSRKLTEDIKEVIDKGIIEKIESEKFNKSDKKLNESDIIWSYASDYTQRKAVRNSITSKGHIIQGPPGTGKTQTILNIVVELVRQNKRVLIVSEKKTAVEVIAKRLKEGEINLFPTYLELYRDDELLTAVKEIAKIIEYSDKRIDIDSELFFKSNKEIMEEVDLFIKTTDKVTNADIESLENLIDCGITSEDVSLINKFIDLNINSEEAFNLIKDKINRLSRMESHINNNYIPKNFMFDIYKKEISIENTYLTIYKNGKKPFWWFGNKLRNKAMRDTLTKQTYKLMFDELKISEEDIVPMNEKILNLVNLSKEPKWKYFNEISKLLSVIQNVNILYSLIQNSSLFKYEDFKDERIFIENRKLALKSRQEMVKKNLYDNPSFKRVLEGLKDRKVVSKIVRGFIKDNWNSLYQLFPVIIGTVESVSEYVPLKEGLFDYVIIDEASQIFTERALPSIFRANNYIISGDKQQLRPYSDKRTISSEAMDDLSMVDYPSWIEYESLLDLFSEILGEENQSLLEVHYRSETYELIKYSNDNFYNSKLSFIPKPISNKIKPIKLVRVERDWSNQVSNNEINKIIEIVEELVANGEESIGIISMSKKQTTALKRTMLTKANERVIELLTSTSEGIFIKPLNDVQGDERDFILFSIGYDGKYARYSYINQAYGGNRLNVAASRARRQMIVVMNGDPNKMAGRNTGNPGTEAFLNFIDYMNNKSIEIENTKKLSALDAVLKKINIENYEILSDGKFEFASYNINKALYILDKDLIRNTKSKLWKYNDILNARGYDVIFDFPIGERINKLSKSGILEELNK